MRRLLTHALVLLVVLLAGCATTVGKPFKPQPVQPFEHNQKFLVGVLPVANVSGDVSADVLVAPLVGAMISEIQANGRYRVIERERLESLLKESEFSLSELADSANAASIGKLLGVEALCFINLSSVAEKTKRATMFLAYVDTHTVETAMDARLVSVATGEILASAKSTVVKGRKHWVALGFMKAGALDTKENLLSEALADGVRDLANQLSLKAPKK